MQRELQKIKKNFKAKLKNISNSQDLKQVERDFLGKKGALKKILNLLKTLDRQEKRKIGKLANQLKKEMKTEIQELKKEFPQEGVEEINEVDITLPGKKIPQGHIHPLTQTLNHVERVFESMGFSVFLSPEVENEYYNFDALNIPPDHPARDLWDTFWLKDGLKIEDQSDKQGKALLRTHTSAMQLRYMKKNNPPFRIITPGKCYRYEASDSTHDIQFYQVDGLVIDKEVSIANFKAVVEELFKKLFQETIRIRLRPGYFPFVEPGFEVDIACYRCQGKKCPICKGTGWLEVMGAGMVHPEVFKHAGYNPQHWQGFAFGMGLDRLAMIKYGISDVRLFYKSDLRFLKQF